MLKNPSRASESADIRDFYKDPDAISRIKQMWFPYLLDGNDYARIVAEDKARRAMKAMG